MGSSALATRQQRQRTKTPHQEAKTDFEKKPPHTSETTRNSSEAAERPRANTSKITKKPFLKSGTGTAGGLGRAAALQKQNKPPVPNKMESKPAEDTGKTEPFQEPRQNNRINRESMDEFEQIE